MMRDEPSPPLPTARRRGRPRKEGGDDDESTRNRRAQVRRAQHAFRTRKEAAQKAQEEHITRLESALEEINSVFIEFSDHVIGSEVLQRDQDTMQRLRETARRIVGLTQNAMDHSSHDAALDIASGTSQGFDINELMATSPGDYLSMAGANPTMGSTPSSLPSDADITSALMGFENFSPSLDLSITSRASEVSPRQAEMPTLPSQEWSFSPNIFGDGFQGRIPILMSQPEVLGMFKGDRFAENSFETKLLRMSLETGYRSLAGALAGEEQAQAAQRIFRFSLMFHSREQLLFSLRWFLGPGSSEMWRLGDFHMRDSPVLDEASRAGRMELDGGPYPLSADIDKHATAAITAEQRYGFEPEEAFMSVLSVVRYLQENMQLEQIDDDTLEVSKPALQRALRNRESILEDVVALENNNSSPSGGSDRSELWLPFTLNALLGNLGVENFGRDRRKISPNRGQTYTLSMALLLRNLGQISVCLARGPAYYRAFLDNAIASAIVNRQQMY